MPKGRRRSLADALTVTISAETLGTAGVSPRPAQQVGLGGIFASRYVVESLVGSGGFGTVYRCRDLVTDREVALAARVSRPPRHLPPRPRSLPSSR